MQNILNQGIRLKRDQTGKISRNTLNKASPVIVQSGIYLGGTQNDKNLLDINYS
jgi:hypothetical protein